MSAGEFTSHREIKWLCGVGCAVERQQKMPGFSHSLLGIVKKPGANTLAVTRCSDPEFGDLMAINGHGAEYTGFAYRNVTIPPREPSFAKICCCASLCQQPLELFRCEIIVFGKETIVCGNNRANRIGVRFRHCSNNSILHLIPPLPPVQPITLLPFFIHAWSDKYRVTVG